MQTAQLQDRQAPGPGAPGRRADPRLLAVAGALAISLTAVFIRLADTGAGIKTEDLAKLFSPYHTTKTGGHGLGLMIVQRIMRDHGGHVGIESKEGVGTVVTLQFPQKHRRVRMLPGT